MIVENEFIKFLLNDSVLILYIKEKGIPDEYEWEFTKHNMLKFYDYLIKNNKKVTIIFNLTNLGLIPLTYVNEWATLFTSNTEKTKLIVNKSIVIIQNPIVYTITKSFLYMYNNVSPYYIINSEKELKNLNLKY